MTLQNVRGAYLTLEHDRAQDWDWLAKWQPNVIRYMGPGNIADPASFSVDRVRRIHETCPAATILLRCWDVDDNNFKAHDAMVADPRAEADRQVNWWAGVISRAETAGVPRSLLMAGLNNETGPEKDAALYPYTEWALKYATLRDIRLGVFVFSVGRPSLAGESQYDIAYFERLEPLIRQNDGAVVLHQYMQPEGMYAVWTDDQGNERKDWTYLMGRDLRWQINAPIIIGEWGIDGLLYNRHPDSKYGNSGWRNFKAEWPPNRYADEYVECIRRASDNVIGICPFIEDWSDHKWQSFDLIDAYGEFITRKDLCVKDVATSTTPPHIVLMPQVGTGPQPPAKTTPAYVSATAGANLRGAPVATLDGYNVLAKVPFGDAVGVYGSSVGSDGMYWSRVRYGEIEGWIRGDLLQAERPVPQPTPTTPAFEDNWARCLAYVRRWEGGWADDPNDSGGATNKGITIGTYTAWRAEHGQPPPTKDDLRNITDQEVERIYFEWYWLKSGSHELVWPLCLCHFDLAVNAGVGKALEILRKSNENFLAYMGHEIAWFAGLGGFEHFGRAWTRRRAEILIEASK